jgi:tetratricopeptide (TPR) repeat protein
MTDADSGSDVFEGAASLVAKSLVQHHTDANGDSRFTMLETIREYAAERLEASGEGEAIRRRHVDYCVELVEQAEDKIRSATDGRWMHRLEVEHDNLRAALSWCDRFAETRHLLPLLANPLWMFWWQRGHWVEACRWYDRVLELTTEPDGRLGALRGRAQIATQSGDFRRAATLWEEGIALAQVTGDLSRLSIMLGRRAYIAALTGDAENAQMWADEGLAIACQLGDSGRIALALNEIAHVARAKGNIQAARLIWEDAVRLSREVGVGFFVPYGLQILSMLAVEQGDLVGATALAEEALPLFRQRDDRWGIQNTQSRIVALAQARGDRTRTAVLARENLILTRDIGSLPPVADHLVYLAWVARLEGRSFRAARLLGAAEAIWETTGRQVRPVQRREVDEELSLLRDALGDAAYTSAVSEGRSFSVDRAIRDALEEGTPAS